MTLVIDVSVAVKWVLEEVDTIAARALVGSHRLIAPDFLLLECANVLSMKAARGLLSADDAFQGLRTVEQSGVQIVSSAPYVRQAQELSVTLKQTAYDCLYLAVALTQGCPLITADARFANAVEPRFPQALRRLQVGA